MIWRAKRHDGTYAANVGQDWVFGTCPVCKAEQVHKILSTVGNVRKTTTKQVYPVMRCHACMTYYIYNYLTYQLVEACIVHWQPIKHNVCWVCSAQEAEAASGQTLAL